MRDLPEFDAAVQDFTALLDDHIERLTRKFMEPGTYIMLSDYLGLSRLLAGSCLLPMSHQNKRLDADGPSKWASISPRVACHFGFDKLSKLSSSVPQMFKSFTYLLASTVALGHLPIALAAPITAPPPRNPSVGFITYFRNVSKLFREELAGPLVSNLALIIALSLAMLGLSSRRMSPALPYVLPIASLGTAYIGLDDRVTSYQLAVLWVFTATLNHQYLSQRLVRFPVSSGFIYLSIVTCGLLLPLSTHYISPMSEGRYSNWLVAGILTSLPTTLFFIWVWVVAFLSTGLAGRIEMVLTQRIERDRSSEQQRAAILAPPN